MKKLTRTRKNKKIRKYRLIILACFILSILAISFFSFNSYHKSKMVEANLSKHKNKKVCDAVPQNILKSIDKVSDSQRSDLRKFPYPYSSMLSICSDIDDATLDEFKMYHKFLNTKSQTSYGQGLGLDVGDSFWMYMGDDSKSPVDIHGNKIDHVMTYFKGTSQNQKNNADQIIHYYNSGWIDCLHTFGDFSTEREKTTLFNRQLAQNAWNTLNSIKLKPTIWINHGNRSNRQNFGAYGSTRFMNYQQGDNPYSRYYHTDITMNNGIKYIWNSWSDCNFGYDYPLYKISLRDGKKVWGFHRYTNNLINKKIDWTWTPKYVNKQLTKDNLDSIVNKKQYSIVAQHFGVNTEDLFTIENINSLKLLKQYQDDKKILVAKTSRLLDYANTHKYLTYQKLNQDGKTYININSINDPIFGKSVPTLDKVRGVTFYCDDAKNTVLLLNKSEISSSDIQINPKDETGKVSISVKWFTPDYTDYTK